MFVPRTITIHGSREDRHSNQIPFQLAPKTRPSIVSSSTTLSITRLASANRRESMTFQVTEEPLLFGHPRRHPRLDDRFTTASPHKMPLPLMFRGWAALRSEVGSPFLRLVRCDCKTCERVVFSIATCRVATPCMKEDVCRVFC